MPKVFEGYTVVELADRRNQFVGKLMSDGGARVIQVEPVTGSPGRHVGPFAGDQKDVNKSLDYWWYNTGKESVAVDVTRRPGQDLLRRLLARADVFVESAKPGTLRELGLDYDSISGINESLVYASLTDFGPDGPWAHLEMNDPAHLALGGQMGVSGYSDPHEQPMGGQGRQAYNMASVMMTHALTVALYDRLTSGLGQYIDIAIHDCCAVCTERSVSYWLWYNQANVRQTGQHAGPKYGPPLQVQAGDGKYLNARTSFSNAHWPKVVEWMEEYGVAGDFADEQWRDNAYRTKEAATVREGVLRLLSKMTADEAFHRAQAIGMTWGVIRAPEENLEFNHFKQREFWEPIEQPEIGKTLLYPRGPWRSDVINVRPDGRAPHLGEHTRPILTRELGYDEAQVEALAQTGVVR